MANNQELPATSLAEVGRSFAQAIRQAQHHNLLRVTQERAFRVETERDCSRDRSRRLGD